MPTLKDSKAYSGFSTDDIAAAKAFYGDTLGLDVSEEYGMLDLALATGAHVLIYPKPNHVAAEYTTLNFPVADIATTVDELAAAGIEFERYDGMNQDERAIAHNEGPLIAWFKDPAGNILSILQE